MSTAALAASLALTAGALVAAPATAAPSENSSCTGQTASNNAQELQPFGQSTVRYAATGLAQDPDPDTNFGQNVISLEATDDDCDD